MPMDTVQRFFKVYFLVAALLGTCVIILTSGCLAQAGHQPSPSQKDSLERFLRNYLGGVRPDVKSTKYLASFVDLRDDGAQEAMVYLTNDGWCGSGGCTTLILSPEGSSYHVIAKIPIVQLPIRVLPTKSHGWRDISVLVEGGGEPSYEAKLSFDGKTYPSNPSMPPSIRLRQRVKGTVIVPSSIEGAHLYPRQILRSQLRQVHQ